MGCLVWHSNIIKAIQGGTSPFNLWGFILGGHLYRLQIDCWWLPIYANYYLALGND